MVLVHSSVADHAVFSLGCRAARVRASRWPELHPGLEICPSRTNLASIEIIFVQLD